MTPKVRKCTNFRVFSKAFRQRSGSFLEEFRALGASCRRNRRVGRNVELGQRLTNFLSGCKCFISVCSTFARTVDSSWCSNSARSSAYAGCRGARGGLYESSRAVTLVDGLPPAPISDRFMANRSTNSHQKHPSTSSNR